MFFASIDICMRQKCIKFLNTTKKINNFPSYSAQRSCLPFKKSLKSERKKKLFNLANFMCFCSFLRKQKLVLVTYTIKNEKETRERPIFCHRSGLGWISHLIIIFSNFRLFSFLKVFFFTLFITFLFIIVLLTLFRITSPPIISPYVMAFALLSFFVGFRIIFTIFTKFLLIKKFIEGTKKFYFCLARKTQGWH